MIGDADAAWERMREPGAELLPEPTVVEPAGVKSRFVEDPDGTMVEFEQPLG